jgi:aspartyl/asparaginyl-tRNA synthetase
MSSDSIPEAESAKTDSRFFRHARDVVVHCRSNADSACAAEIRGLVIKKTLIGKIVFLTVVDATGSIQVVCNKGSLDETTWTVVQNMKTRCRILAAGKVAKTRAGELSVFAESLSVVISPDRGLTHLADSFQHFGLTGRFFLARLRRRATDFFVKEGYEEYEPNFLTPVPDDSHIKPLSVVFQGWGNPAYLNTAPISQLLESVLVTGSPKVFSVGRCFSDAVRDGFTSAESMIACAVELDASSDLLLSLSIRAVQYVFNDITTMPQEVNLNLEEWAREEIALENVDHSVTQPTIQIVRVPSDETLPRGPLSAVFRLVLPPDIAVAEGHCQELEGDTSVGGVTLHLERMLKLIKEVVLSRLRKT